MIYWLVAWHHTAPQKNMYIISHQHHQTSNQLHFLGLFLDVSSLGKTAVQQKYLKIQIWVFAVTLKTQFTKSKTSCILWDYLFLTTKFFWICRFGGWNCHFFQRFHSKGLPPQLQMWFFNPNKLQLRTKKNPPNLPFYVFPHQNCLPSRGAFSLALGFFSASPAGTASCEASGDTGPIGPAGTVAVGGGLAEAALTLGNSWENEEKPLLVGGFNPERMGIFRK